MRVPVKSKQNGKAERDSKVELVTADSGRMGGQGFKAASAFIDLSCSIEKQRENTSYTVI